MTRKVVVYVWICCLCGSQWNKSTTPACLDCGHQRGRCDRIFEVPTEVDRVMPLPTKHRGTPTAQEDDSQRRATDAASSADGKSKQEPSHLLPSPTVSEAETQLVSSRGRQSDPAQKNAVNDSKQPSHLGSQQVFDFPSSSNNPVSDHGAVLQPDESQRHSIVLKRPIGRVAETVPLSSTNTVRSAWSSLMSKFTKSTHETLATSQSSKTSATGLYPTVSRQEAAFAVAAAEGQPGAEPSQDGMPDADDLSVVSRGSTMYAPEQVEEVVSRFTGVVLKQLRSSSEYGPMNASTQHHLLKDLRAALETFCEAVHLDGSRPHMQAVKIIRRVRGKIASRIYEKIIRTAEDPESTRPEVPGQEMGCADRVELLWHSRAPLSISSLTIHTVDNLLSDPQSLSILTTQTDESWDHDDPRQVWGEGVDPAEILKTITGDEAFETLIRETERVLDRYNCQKMDLIRRRTSLCLRRSGLGSIRKTYSAQFHVDWNLRAFMEKGYECGVRQDINAIAAVTGTTDNALLCSVGEYFASQWPSSSKPLLDAITRSFQPQSNSSRLFGRSLRFYFPEIHS